jgi:hypothetical protein
VAISKNGIPIVIIDFSEISIFAATVAANSSEESLKGEIVLNTVRIDFAEISIIAKNILATSSDTNLPSIANRIA